MRILFLPPDQLGQVRLRAVSARVEAQSFGVNQLEAIGRLVIENPELFGISEIGPDLAQITRLLILEGLTQKFKEPVKPAVVFEYVINRGKALNYSIKEEMMREAILDLSNQQKITVTSGRMVTLPD